MSPLPPLSQHNTSFAYEFAVAIIWTHSYSPLFPSKRHRPVTAPVPYSHCRFEFHSTLLTTRVTVFQLHGARSLIYDFLSVSVLWLLYFQSQSHAPVVLIIVRPSSFTLSWCDPFRSHSSSAGRVTSFLCFRLYTTTFARTLFLLCSSLIPLSTIRQWCSCG